MNKRRPGRGPKISNEVRRLIIGQAIHDSKHMPRRALAVRLQDLIEKMGEISPTEDTLVKMISEARNQQPSEFDRPWSIGTCAQYNIPPDIIPVLIWMQQFRARSELKILQKELTIREAQWFTRLCPVAEILTRKQFPHDAEARLRFLALIVNCYVQRERVSELMNEQYPDTSELDRILFIYEDFSSDAFFEVWWSTRSEQEHKAAIDVLKRKRISVIKKLEKSLGHHLTAAEADLINGYFDAAISGPIALREWEMKHPAVQEQKMLRFSWIEIYIEALEGNRQ